MSKYCKGWKVLAANFRCSVSDKERGGPLGNELSVIYPAGVKVFPKLKKAKLFFFKHFEDAKRFECACSIDAVFTCSRDASKYITVPCIATNPKEFHGSISGRYAYIKVFWECKNMSERRHRFISISFPPSGTYVADAIKCLE